MAYEFYLGIDAVDRNGKTEIATALVEKRQDGTEPEYVLHSLHRHDNKDAESVAEFVAGELSGDPFVGRTVCVSNVSENAGERLTQRLSDEGLSALTLRITGGDTSAEQGRPLSFGDGGTQVSEHEVISTIEEIYRSGRLDTSAVKTEEPTALVQGLEDYHVSAGEAGEALDGADTSPSRSAAHSTLVLAAASAVWLGEQQSFDPTEHLAGDPPPVRRAKQEMRPDTT